jgi:hypothetical protein
MSLIEKKSEQMLEKQESISLSVAEKALIGGDLSKMSSEERLQYYNAICTSLNLNPLTRPFEYLNLNGKLTLYVRKDATDQLRKNNEIWITLTSKEVIGDMYVVTARARMTNNRIDESTGVVYIKGLGAEQLANAMMKAETKAKRRVTLSICGLGWTDESELDTIPNARKWSEPVNEIAQAKANYIAEQTAVRLDDENRRKIKSTKKAKADDDLLASLEQEANELKGADQ